DGARPSEEGTEQGDGAAQQDRSDSHDDELRMLVDRPERGDRDGHAHPERRRRHDDERGPLPSRPPHAVAAFARLFWRSSRNPMVSTLRPVTRRSPGTVSGSHTTATTSTPAGNL